VNARADSPATRRNRDAILDVLSAELAESTNVLEIGSGTGQHAVYFGRAMPHLQWQTSDRKSNHEGIRAWLEAEGTANVLAPMDLDVLNVSQVDRVFDAVFSANTAHIMSMDAVRRMFALVGDSLAEAGLFCLYGPFNLDGRFTSESNRRFDASLRDGDRSMGIRDLQELDVLAEKAGMARLRRYAMPANNLLIVWQKRGKRP
jgi:cyclopropane fatty-acyl-phospholipid synthase-like methyltransferase